MSMRIVLLGATGFVGRHLLPELSRRGHSCDVICRNKSRCGHLLLVPGVRLKQLPALNVESLAAELAGADAVINLIGILNERGRNGKGFHAVHVGTAEMLIEACKRAGVGRVIQISAVNAGKGKSHYLISKGQAEERLRQADFLDVTIVQPSVIFGDGDAFFNRFTSLLKSAPALPLACPDSRLQPVWVGDVVRAVGNVLEAPWTIGRTLELVGPKTYTLAQLVGWTAHAAGLRRLIVRLPDPLSRLQGRVMDFVPGKPFSSDNYKSLQVDNVSKHNALPELGITPHSIKAKVPDYLTGTRHQQRLTDWRLRPGSK
jgi:NADH dehydrogenase